MKKRIHREADYQPKQSTRMREAASRAPDSPKIPAEVVRHFDRSGPRYTSYPTADRFHPGFEERAYKRQLAARATAENNPPLSLYVHLPFCRSLCYFCACNKVITHDHGCSARYLSYLVREMDLVASHLGPDRRTVQLHLGGGTPTFFPVAELEDLVQQLQNRFAFSIDAELAIEIDPRTVSNKTLSPLARLGFNRASFGVQDFATDVQQAVNRIQPLDVVERALSGARDAGFPSINVDLIYGLPQQTAASFARTLDEVIRLAPDRVALYNYAHLPDRFKAQRLIDAARLPSTEERLRIFLLSAQRFLDAGYIYIGLDHFARPDDELSIALRNGSLHRNFQGYTTYAECDLVGFGVSAIGKIGSAYSQSTSSLQSYYRSLDEGRLPVERGIALSPDDALRREVIMTLMCSVPLNFAAISLAHQIDFVRYFSSELTALEPYREAGLVSIDGNGISIPPKGRFFVRAVAMVFDGYLERPSSASWSKLI
ncbi:Oxygen-independent coproporphyrinogen III oxidase [Paraburkholderia rhynchosiae]|uniref:Coproporphyrinogen-III oxidase n=2 Tax=Paraburkholderia rhynchosiae TaxID=487049 RepID=A0A6J5AJE4_9BURK|nr:Oxygen-independent coproporphyrinogen III oxidase [Paraburkholderia rhynchosiae]